MKFVQKSLSLLLLVTPSIFAGQIGALTPTATELVTSGGEVVVYFAGQTAGLDSVLNLISPVSVGPFFPNHSTPVGTAFSLGTFAAGETLRFRLDVAGGNSFFSGPASGNPDNIIHVAHATWQSDATIPFDGVLVGFEDLLGGGDLDFDDNTFVFTNVASPVIAPEPASMMLAAAGVGLMAFLRKRL